MSTKRRAAARGRPVERATSLSVSVGLSASKARITASPRCSDCTKSVSCSARPIAACVIASPPVSRPRARAGDAAPLRRRRRRLERSAPTRSSHPVAACTSASVTPGCTWVSTSSRVTGSGSSTPRSVITAVGPPPLSPRRRRSSPPAPWPSEVTKSSRSTNRSRVWRATMITSAHEAAISGAPPAPGSRTDGASYDADHRRVDVGEAVDLRRAEEANVDATRLEPVVEDLDQADNGIGGLGEGAVADRERQVLRLGPDRARLVDEHEAGLVEATGQVRRRARQPDADEAGGAVREGARRGDRHHLRGSPRRSAGVRVSACEDIVLHPAAERVAVAADRIPRDVEVVVPLGVAVRVGRVRTVRHG